jgi:hypothetical protein
VSKERARRRAEREREAAIRAAARAEEQERQERRAARRAALTRRLPGGGATGPTGVLDRRRGQRIRVLLLGLTAINLLVWFARDDWGVRAGVLVVSVLAAPVLFVLLFPRP